MTIRSPGRSVSQIRQGHLFLYATVLRFFPAWDTAVPLFVSMIEAWPGRLRRLQGYRCRFRPGTLLLVGRVSPLSPVALQKLLWEVLHPRSSLEPSCRVLSFSCSDHHRELF